MFEHLEKLNFDTNYITAWHHSQEYSYSNVLLDILLFKLFNLNLI